MRCIPWFSRQRTFRSAKIPAPLNEKRPKKFFPDIVQQGCFAAGYSMCASFLGQPRSLHFAHISLKSVNLVSEHFRYDPCS